MRRSKVRSGMIDGRDRGTKRRRRHRREAETAVTAGEALKAWFETHRFDPLFGDLMAVRLDDYLRATQHIELSPAERLRKLAVELELGVPGRTATQGWDALRRIYDAARRHDPDDPLIDHSMGLSAFEYAQSARYRGDEDGAGKLYQVAHDALQRAASRAPTDARIAYSQGHATYSDPGRTLQHALEHFEYALALDPGHAWALLYRAHCLHDLQRWSKAADAYAAVPKGAFTGGPAWRMDLLVEQRASCLLKAQRLDEARAQFLVILQRYEAQPHLARWGDLKYLDEAAAGEMPELRGRVDALRERLEEV